MLCECECNEYSVSMKGRVGVFERGRVSVSTKSRAKTEILCVCLFCVRISEWTYGDYKGDCILFSGNGLAFWE